MCNNFAETAQSILACLLSGVCSLSVSLEQFLVPFSRVERRYEVITTRMYEVLCPALSAFLFRPRTFPATVRQYEVRVWSAVYSIPLYAVCMYKYVIITSTKPEKAFLATSYGRLRMCSLRTSRRN